MNYVKVIIASVVLASAQAWCADSSSGTPDTDNNLCVQDCQSLVAAANHIITDDLKLILKEYEDLVRYTEGLKNETYHLCGNSSYGDSPELLVKGSTHTQDTLQDILLGLKPLTEVLAWSSKSTFAGILNQIQNAVEGSLEEAANRKHKRGAEDAIATWQGLVENQRTMVPLLEQLALNMYCQQGLASKELALSRLYKKAAPPFCPAIPSGRLPAPDSSRVQVDLISSYGVHRIGSPSEIGARLRLCRLEGIPVAPVSIAEQFACEKTQTTQSTNPDCKSRTERKSVLDYYAAQHYNSLGAPTGIRCYFANCRQECELPSKLDPASEQCRPDVPPDVLVITEVWEPERTSCKSVCPPKEQYKWMGCRDLDTSKKEPGLE